MSNVQVTCFGEVLWDIFPTHEVIGGAPLNVALRLQSFGVNVAMISSIGNDAYGQKALDYLRENNMETSYVQIEQSHKTGHVLVSLDDKGSASYEIFNPVAWDHIHINQENIDLVSNSEVLVYGSLACRAKTSHDTLLQLIENANYKVFDVNLRPPDYSVELIVQLMNKADFIKMNDEELEEICDSLQVIDLSIDEQIEFIAQETNTNTICVTKGGDGAVLFQNNEFYKNSGYKVIVEDTVGAGDSFLASLINKLLLEKTDPQESIDFACAVGSLVASKKGANSRINPEEIKQLLES